MMQLRISVLILIFLISIIPLTESFAQIDSQWRGNSRTGIYTGEKLLTKWPADGPKLLWSFDKLGEGYSSVAIAENKVFINGMIDEQGFLFAFDMQGKLLWKINYGAEWSEGHPGARSTPTIVGGKLYILTGLAKVVCVNTSDGKIVWSNDLVKSYGAEILRWGMAESLVIDGDLVYCTPGGSKAFMVAFDRHTGKEVKTVQAGGIISAYCAPVMIVHNEKKLILTMTGETVICIDPESGKVLWQKKHKTKYGINPNTPVYMDGNIFTVSGYGTGAQMFKPAGDGKNAELIWQNDIMDSQMGAAIIIDGYIYGTGQTNKGWHCLEAKTGKLMYTSKDFGRKGNVIHADGMLYCYDENGSVGLVRPAPDKFNVISSFEIKRGSGPHWAHPVIANGRLYVRHGDTLMVFDISAK